MAALAVLVSGGACAGVEPSRVEAPGQWSSTAVDLGRGLTASTDAPANSRIANVWSADHLRVLVIDGSRLTVKNSNGTVLAEPVQIGSLSEIEWSPDSRGFVVTESDGGLVGSWSATAYRLTSTGLAARNLGQLVSSEFQKREGACSEIPNVGASGWLESGILLVVAEAPPHSSCRDMGAIRGYEVSAIDGKILKRYDEAELRARYGHRLGLRFRVTP
ncbi:MAG TPA: hypothetical protein VJ527_10335 [Rhodanobacter sp.]|nr:hypothetical protein [Rhodanobacter sp.]